MTTTRSRSADTIAGAVLGLAVGFGLLIVGAGLHYIVAALSRDIIAVVLAGTVVLGGITGALTAGRPTRPRRSPDRLASVELVVEEDIEVSTVIDLADRDPFGRDWKGHATLRILYRLVVVGGPRDGDVLYVPGPDIRSADLLTDPNPADLIAAATSGHAHYAANPGDDWTEADDGALELVVHLRPPTR